MAIKTTERCLYIGMERVKGILDHFRPNYPYDSGPSVYGRLLKYMTEEDSLRLEDETVVWVYKGIDLAKFRLLNGGIEWKHTDEINMHLYYGDIEMFWKEKKGLTWAMRNRLQVMASRSVATWNKTGE